MERKIRADAQQNLEAVLEAAKAVFETSGVDAPVREIADRAGVGVATLYRRFPLRTDLIAAVFRREVDACAAAAAAIAKEHAPGDAVGRWLQRYADLIGTKRGLATALHAGDPAYRGLAEYFVDQLEPALESLLAPAIREGEIRGDVEAYELLRAVGNLLVTHTADRARSNRRMVDVFVDGLRVTPRSAPSGRRSRR